MFTGIIRHLGRFSGYDRGKRSLLLEAEGLQGRLKPGDSLCINGVCLTLTAEDRGRFRFDLSLETLSRTTLGRLRPGCALNLDARTHHPAVAIAD